MKIIKQPIYSKIILKLEASFNYNFLKKAIYNLIKENNLNISSKKNLFIDLKKNNKISVTVISGPHVHKKSREQLALSSYKSFIEININNKDDLKSFLIFKEKLHQKKLSNHSVNISFNYLTKENFTI